jgi:hypothetical protein
MVFRVKLVVKIVVFEMPFSIMFTYSVLQYLCFTFLLNFVSHISNVFHCYFMFFLQLSNSVFIVVILEPLG